MSTSSASKPISFWLKWAANIIVPLIFVCIPVGGDFTSSIKWFLVVTVFAICLIATESIPIFATSLVLPFVYIVFFKIPAANALGPWTGEIPWLIISSFLLANCLQRTGVLRRMSYRCVLLCGGRLSSIMIGLPLAGIIVSLVVTDPNPKIVIFLTLASGICEALNLEKGGKTSTAIGLAALTAAMVPSYLFYTGAVNNIVAFGVAAGAGVEAPGWIEYLGHMFVPQMITLIVMVAVLLLVFKPKGAQIESKEYFKMELQKLGPMSRDEKVITVLAVILLALVATSSLHKTSLAAIFVFIAAITFLPGIRLSEPKHVSEVNFGFVIFVVACLSIGGCAVFMGVGSFVGQLLYPIISGSQTQLFAGTWLMGFVVNFVLTPLAAYSAFTVPVVEFAMTAGINPLPIIYAFLQGLEQLLLPYEYAPYLLAFSFGLFPLKRMSKFLGIKAVLGFILLLLVYMPWWRLIGLL